MAVQEDQLAALRVGRNQVVRVRTERLEDRELCNERVQAVELEIKRTIHRLGILRVEYNEARRSAQAMTDVWLGREVPQLTQIEIDKANGKVDELRRAIDALERFQNVLTKQHDERKAELFLLDKGLAEAQTELKQIDERISEIRGFAL